MEQTLGKRIAMHRKRLKLTQEQLRLALELLSHGKSYRQVTALTGISKSTLMRAKKAT